MKMVLRIILSGLALAWAFYAQAAPARIEDCEKISGTDAYNYCLASFGPKRGVRAARPIGASEPREYAGRPGRKNPASTASLQRDKKGRITVYFDIGSLRKANRHP